MVSSSLASMVHELSFDDLGGEKLEPADSSVTTYSAPRARRSCPGTGR
jgi:hypothetical protein